MTSKFQDIQYKSNIKEDESKNSIAQPSRRKAISRGSFASGQLRVIAFWKYEMLQFVPAALRKGARNMTPHSIDPELRKYL